MTQADPASRSGDAARLSFERALRWAFWFPAGSMAAIVLILSGQFTWLAYTGREMKESVREASMVQELQRLVVEAETGLRGFLLSRDRNPEFLAPYRRAEPRIKPLLTQLDEAFDGQAHGYGNGELASIEQNVDRWLQSAAADVGNPPSGDRLAAQLEERQTRMNQVRSELDRLAAEAESRRQRAIQWTQRSVVATFASVYVLAVAATTGFISFSRRQLRNLHEAHRCALAEAEAASAAKERFMAILSHELRTPLHAILSWIQLTRLSRGSPAQDKVYEESLDVIERNVVAQSQLVEDLLDLSRLSAGRVELRREPTDLGRLVTEAIESIRHVAHARDLEIIPEILCDGAQVSGDPDRLNQIVSNLLTNAIKFTGPGGRVRVTVRSVDDDFMEMVISDTGRGIPAESLARIFEPFFMADTSTTRREKGLGLGLAIVRLLTEAHGGSVYAASDGPGQGATFTVRIPAPPANLLSPARPHR
ncbi:MAG: CHASE3 domain-containing protein [Verrucomicrobia bacterium]|nr:CHASE3 domain-containing protein [Verrucomicrobiota bacterium]